MENTQSKLNYIDSITLEYLADNYSSEKNIKNKETIPVEDIKFYRKRLNNMFKEKVLDLIKNNGENVHSTKVINTLIFNVIKEGIKELKHDDWSELQNNEIIHICFTKY